tara:strand:- start:168 stop:398 length:231 start_codon:yes stop_codon:yes gene_type:complete
MRVSCVSNFEPHLVYRIAVRARARARVSVRVRLRVDAGIEVRVRGSKAAEPRVLKLYGPSTGGQTRTGIAAAPKSE